MVRNDSKRQSTSFSCSNITCVNPERHLSDLFLEIFSSRDCTTCCSPLYDLRCVTTEMLSEVNIHIALCMLETLTISVFQLLVTENQSIDTTEYILSVGVGEKCIL